MERQRLVLIRHAHRDTQFASADNGLSEKGHRQVHQLIRFSKNRELEDASWFSSPKKRCIETLGPVFEKWTGRAADELTIEPAIGEGCTEKELQMFLDQWKYEGPESTVLCSHGDIIPIIVKRLTGGLIAIKKAGWCEIERVGNDCFLTMLVQSYE